MKKVVVVLAVAAVLILAGVVVFKRSGGPSQASLLAPGDAVVFANVPNIPLTGFRWTRTSLAQIAAEPEVRAFLEKPLKNLHEAATSGETGKTLMALKPGNVYLAATSATGEDFQGIAGVQFWGKREDFDNAVAKLRAALPEGSPEPVRSEHRGLEILTTRHGDLELHSAAAGRWGFVSNEIGLIQDAIDRATGNSSRPSLGANPRFLKVVAELLAEPDFLVFAQPEKAVEGLLAAGRSMGATPIPGQVGQLKATEAAGAAWKIDRQMFRDAFFLLRPNSGQPVEPLTHRAMALTTPDSAVFFNFVLNFSALPAWVDWLADISPQLPQTLAPLAKLVADGYGPECAILADWPTGALFPTPLLALQVRNPDANLLAKTAPAIPGASVQTVGSRQVVTIPSPYSPLVAAQDERFLVLGTNPELVGSALENHAKTLQDSPLFQEARSAYRNSNEAFCFLDTRTVFERSYGSLLPVIRMGAAILPDLGSQIDVAKLPKPETIGQHLPPIVFSQKRTADGTRLESSGPVSMSQFLMILGAAGQSLDGSFFGN